MGIVVTLLAVSKSTLDNTKPIERQLHVVAEVECGKRLLHLLELDPQGEGRDDSTGDIFHWSDSTNKQTMACAQSLLKLARSLNNSGLDEFGSIVARDGIAMFTTALSIVTEGDHMIALRWA